MILVVGPGHSGTTNVCRVLKENWGVCWGHGEDGGPIPPGKNGKPFYEDPLAKRLLIAKVARSKMDILEWKKRVIEAHPRRCKRIGVKLIQFATHLGIGQLQDIEPELIIRTSRERESCIRSWMRGMPNYEAAADGYDRREARLQMWERRMPMLKMEFDPERRVVPDEEIINWISGCWGVAPLSTK